MINGLSQTLLKIISTGIPDFYQGSELWDFRLVDPDNRQPSTLGNAKGASPNAAGKSGPADLCYGQTGKKWRDGRIKLYLIWKALNYRRSTEAIFAGRLSLATSQPFSFFTRQYTETFSGGYLMLWLGKVALPKIAFRASADSSRLPNEVQLDPAIRASFLPVCP